MAVAFVSAATMLGSAWPVAPPTATAPRSQTPALRSWTAAGAAAEQQRSGGGVALLTGLVAAATLRRHRRAATQRNAGDEVRIDYKPEEWVKRVKMIEGERAVFDVTIPKPLGLIPANFPNRPGVGVAKINEGGNTDTLNRKVIVDGDEGMWVLEGDEVIAVNGENVEGKSLDVVGPLVKESEGDSVKLTLCRHYMAGPVKVVFLPSGKVATMKRGIEISKAAEVGVEDVSFSCKEGWCKACWHTDPMWGIVYRACSAASKKRPPPKNPRTIPMKWNNVVPLWLLNWRESTKWAKAKKAAREAKKAGATQ
eukprot:gb/GFBE01035308.1/.p1 GENE.gb/GFBE01035308.1/~~gb/GFBE01035308.1/.p1  ORF type:complete len:310 (+),score=70.11 gb/GFBE01035308.1/:1-930(+)